MAEYDDKGGYGSGYGKRPMWQWILLYIVIGGILYYGVYYYFLKDNYSKEGSGGLYGSSESSTSDYNYDTSTDSTSSPYTDLKTSTDKAADEATDAATESAEKVLDEGATTTE